LRRNFTASTTVKFPEVLAPVTGRGPHDGVHPRHQDRRPADLVGHLKRFHTYLGDVNWDALAQEVESFVVKFRAQSTNDLDYGVLFNEMFAIGRRYHVRPVTDMTLVLVAMVTSQGIGTMLDPEVNVFAHVARHLVPILMKRKRARPRHRVGARRAGLGLGPANGQVDRGSRWRRRDGKATVRTAGEHPRRR